MTPPPATSPPVTVEKIHPTLRVADLAAAIDYYTTKLGFTEGFRWGDPPAFGGVNLGGVQLFLDANDGPPSGPASVFFVVDDVDLLHAHHVAQGVPIAHPIGVRDYEIRDYTVRDRDGHFLTFGSYAAVIDPSMVIERVDVPVRLEKRLAAVLQELAEVKGMSLSSVLEETLLHTFEPLGDGVASPHTKAQLRAIQALKAKHGIDYDCHASYRFTEAPPA